MPISVNISPNEFVLAGFVPAIDSDVPLDPQSAQSAVRLRGATATIKLSQTGKRATIAGAVTPGRHILEVENLHATTGTRVADRIVVPFFVVESGAKVPRGSSILSFARLVFESTSVRRLSPFAKPRGRFVDVMKVVNDATGTARELAFDQSGTAVDIAALRNGVREAQARAYGKQTPTLAARGTALRGSAKVRVAIWVIPELPKAPLHDKGEPTAAADAPTRTVLAAAARAREAVVARLRALGVDERRVRADRRAPVVYAALTQAQLKAVSAEPAVGALLLDEDDTAVLDLDTSVVISNADDVQSAGYKGKGVNVAVWEDGPDDTTNLTVAAQFTTSPSTTDHARLTHAVIRNTQSPGSNGYAPECSLHSANSTERAALTWAAEQGCTVISQSFHRATEPKASGMESDDLYKDWLALHWPYPTIVQAAGNYWSTDPDGITPPEDEYVNHKGYNSLAVGNHDDTAGSMSGSSVYRNPSTTHGDRELPEICGNGTGITAVRLTKSGTSFAAPAVAGCAALLQSVSGTLKSWPEGCRAILLAGANRNVSDSTWWNDVASGTEAHDGSGAVDAQESMAIAKVRKARNNTASRRGWDVGTLRSADFGGDGRSTFSYKVTVPASGATHVKVALAWNSKVTEFSVLWFKFYLSFLTLDMDLMVYDAAGTRVAYSGSWDNSYEIAEFTGKPGETYTIRIRRWSGTDDTWYGLAWTVV